MKVEESRAVLGLLVITPDVFYDFRGQYVETYNDRDWRFRDLRGEPIRFVQDDVSVSRKDVLRGLHGDANTWKLIQCLLGSIYFVVVDARKDSPTRGNWQAFTLGDVNRQQVLVPAGCVNGHLCLSDTCLFHYKQSTLYEGADKQFTLRWDGHTVYWPIKEPILSQRDANGKAFAELP
jgi:dTDP-4-dehydrorhamnose 3,5-epimerase